jgi:hypothetical protein
MRQGAVRWFRSRNRCPATSPQLREWAARQVVNVGQADLQRLVLIEMLAWRLLMHRQNLG